MSQLNQTQKKKSIEKNFLIMEYTMYNGIIITKNHIQITFVGQMKNI